jgi:hypothetical protein
LTKRAKNLEFDPATFEDLAWWIEKDRKKALRIVKLIREVRIAIHKHFVYNFINPLVHFIMDYMAKSPRCILINRPSCKSHGTPHYSPANSRRKRDERG